MLDVCALQLAKNGNLNLKTIRHFIIDECDKVLESIGEHTIPPQGRSLPLLLQFLHAASLHLQCTGYRAGPSLCAVHLIDTAAVLAAADMRADVQDIFKQTPHDKQVMMFSATLSAEIRPICKKFMTDVCPFFRAFAPARRPGTLHAPPHPCRPPLLSSADLAYWLRCPTAAASSSPCCNLTRDAPRQQCSTQLSAALSVVWV